MLRVITEGRIQYASSSIEFFAYHACDELVECGKAVLFRQVQL